MIVAGRPRSNAMQLAGYLLTPGDNERITIMDVDGRQDADQQYLKDVFYSMELNSELTRSRNSVYHAYINPNPTDTTDRAMTMEEWYRSADILSEQLGYQDQRRVIILHEKAAGRVHAHIVYERYDHAHGRMKEYRHNWNGHDRARNQIEKELGHKRTPQKNANRDRHKQRLTEIWNRTATAQEFITEAEAEGYRIAKGTNRPFRIVDQEGVSFDLVKKIDRIQTKDVKARFADIDLIPEKQAIREMQQRKQQRQEAGKNTGEEARKETKTIEANQSAPGPAQSGETEREAMRRKFLEQVKDVREAQRSQSYQREITLSILIALRLCFPFKDQPADNRQSTKQNYPIAACRITAQEPKPPKRMPGVIEAAQFYNPHNYSPFNFFYS